MMALKNLKRPEPKAPAGPDLSDPTGTDEGDTGDDGIPMQDPRNASKDGQTVFIDADLFPGDCEIGDKYEIIATVVSKGTKIGLTPEDVEPYDEAAEAASGEPSPDQAASKSNRKGY